MSGTYRIWRLDSQSSIAEEKVAEKDRKSKGRESRQSGP